MQRPIERAAVLAPVGAEHEQHLLVIGVRGPERMLHLLGGIGLLVIGPGRRAHARSEKQRISPSLAVS
jgi:hypothetical protein